ncbi:metallophosphoesterase [Pseudomonas sp. KNUC1026]|uniref:metallophosphoesterase n=1 Tax=Pseudomonas sp. KNUC1026 TaxID=2893890 RepID=UPI001F36CDC5|nr:metallophosphoesterase [Pseudomonas sp. KNUC1026]UFH49591.1 metallophosphoesterase family protein [Pseudomonas sp. KNUC1026]
MRILIYSDLHLEFGAGFEPPDVGAELVVLAGDISKGVKAVQWANDAFEYQVVQVAGNHEFYSGHLHRTWQKMKDAAAPHVRLLENESFVWKGLRVLGCTAWTDFSVTGDAVAASRQALEQMNDYKRIRIDDNYRKLRPADVIKRNRAAFTWLTSELGKPFDGPTMVVTHHAPVPDVMGDEHEGHLSAAYANDWPQLLAQADVWVFGHTHRAVDTYLHGCRVISNPKGYPGESTGFSPALVIDL